MIERINLNKVTDETEPPDPVYHVVLSNSNSERIFEGPALDDIAHDVACFLLQQNHTGRPCYRVNSVPNGYAAVDDSGLEQFRKAFKERVRGYWG